MQDSPTIHLPPAPTGILDAQLLEAWVRHQRQADFTEIVRRHLGLVQGIARRQLDQDHAEDIAQQVFAILARKASSLGDLRSLSAWLHRVTLLQCRTAVRRRIRDRRNQEAAMETLRIAEHARRIEAMGAEPADKLTQRRERDARVDAWFATKLTPDQQQSRKQMEDARTASFTAELATSAVQEISADLNLTEEQQTKLYEAAAEKVTRELKEKPDTGSFNLGFRVLFTAPTLPVEEEAQDWVGGILDPAQMELWKVAIERDRSFGDIMQKRVIGNVFDQLAKIKPTQEELLKPFEK